MSYPDALVQAVLSTQSDGIIAADRDGIIVFWNPGAERIFGKQATRPLANHWTSSSRNDCESAIGKAISMSWRAARADTAMATSSRFQA